MMGRSQSPGQALVMVVIAGVVSSVLTAIILDRVFAARAAAAGSPLPQPVAPGQGSA